MPLITSFLHGKRRYAAKSGLHWMTPVGQEGEHSNIGHTYERIHYRPCEELSTTMLTLYVDAHCSVGSMRETKTSEQGDAADN